MIKITIIDETDKSLDRMKTVRNLLEDEGELTTLTFNDAPSSKTMILIALVTGMIFGFAAFFLLHILTN